MYRLEDNIKIYIKAECNWHWLDSSS